MPDFHSSQGQKRDQKYPRAMMALLHSPAFQTLPYHQIHKHGLKVSTENSHLTKLNTCIGFGQIYSSKTSKHNDNETQSHKLLT